MPDETTTLWRVLNAKDGVPELVSCKAVFDRNLYRIAAEDSRRMGISGPAFPALVMPGETFHRSRAAALRCYAADLEKHERTLEYQLAEVRSLLRWTERQQETPQT